MSNLSELLPAGSGAKVAEFVASGTLASGQTVALKTDGTVEVVALTSVSGAVGTTSQFSGGDIASSAIAYDSTNNKILVAYSDYTASQNGKAVVGTVSGTNITFGTPVQFSGPTLGDNNRRIGICFNSTEGKFVIAYRDSSINNSGRAITATISGTSVSFGSSAVFTSDVTNHPACSFDSTSNRVVISYKNDSQSNTLYAIVGTISGTNLSFGTQVQFESRSNANFPTPVYDANANKTVIVWSSPFGGGTSGFGVAIVGTVSGTSISFGSMATFSSSNTEHQTAAFDSVNNKIVVAYANMGNSGYGTSIVGTVSGTSISFGTAAVFHSIATGNVQMQAAYNVKAGKTVIGYGGSNVDGTYVEATVSGTSLSFSSPVTFESVGYINQAPPIAAYDSTNFLVLFSFREAAVGTGDAVAIRSAYATSNNTDFVGITNQAINNSASGEVVVEGGVITNSNFLPAVYTPSSGTPVVFEAGDIGNSNGLPSVAFDSNSNKIVIAYTDVANSGQGTVIVGTVSGTSISYGTAVVFETGSTSYSSVVFDSNSNKIVIAYRDAGDSNYGKAIVGTVSGTSISFGTAVTFETANSDHISATFDSNSNKVVIAYRDDGNSSYGTAIVGTVSGTSISFGTAVVYASVNAQSKSMAFDSNLNKVIIAFRNFNNAGYSWAVVGTVSGTSISFGTTVVYSSTATEHLSVIFDSSNNKAVLTARDSNNKGIAVVGTVSGTSISFGSAVIYSGSSTADWGFAVFDAAANKVVISYSDLSNSSHGTVIVGTVSGTSITFGTPVVFNNAGDTNYIGSGFDSNLNKVVTAYQDANNSNYGTSVVVTITGASPALTIGTDYFVQTDGTLSTTTSTVPAGRALSATSILLEG